MTTKHKPATALPWHVTADPRPTSKQPCIATTAAGLPVILATVCGGQRVTNAAYIAHAANAYPRLVAALRKMIRTYTPALTDATPEEMFCFKEYTALLRELGEE